MLRTAGVRDVTCRLWKDGRHELHNELNRDEVLRAVLAWVEKRI
jgi:alpha-beta hydrolase superfamily lysophospholipase